MTELFEVFMLVCFGASWPVSLYKSVHSKSTAGKSLLFMSLIFVGYVCGIVSKLTHSPISYVIYFYCVNLVMIGCDIAVYFHNKRREAR